MPILPCYYCFLSLLAILWKSTFKWVYPSFSPLLFASFLFIAICKASSDSHFAFSYCSWDSQCKNTEVVFHSLLQRTTFCQTSPPWSSHLGWPHMACFSFIELYMAVVHVIRLASFLWLWFQCACPLIPSCNTYYLIWVSLILDVGYLFTVAPAKRSHRSWPWMWVISSQLLLLTLDMGYLLLATPAAPPNNKD